MNDQTSKNKWNETPWIYQSGKIISHDRYGDVFVVLGEYADINESLARRIVVEHNVMASIKDPEAWIKSVKDAFEFLGLSNGVANDFSRDLFPLKTSEVDDGL